MVKFSRTRVAVSLQLARYSVFPSAVTQDKHRSYVGTSLASPPPAEQYPYALIPLGSRMPSRKGGPRGPQAVTVLHGVDPASVALG